MSREENKKIHENYVAEARKRELSNYQAYDKAVLTLSSSTLGFSLVAIELENVDYLAVMVISWICLIIAIMFTLLAFIISNKAINKSIDDFGKDSKNTKDLIGRWLTNTSGVFLMLAIIMIISFKWYNI